MSSTHHRTATAESILERRNRVFGSGSPLFYEHPLHFVRGKGVWLIDAEGRRYLDAYNNVPVVGHGNAHVNAALARQSKTHQVHSRYLDELILDYSERLLALHAPGLDNVVFGCTGTEVNEVAIRMARIATRGEGFVTTNATYHGHTTALMRFVRAQRSGRREVHGVPYPQRYRPIEEGLSDDELTSRYLAELQGAIDDFAAEGVPFAGMIICPLFANEGLPDVLPGFHAAAAQMVRAAGGVVIFDEVQSGLGRTGTWWFYEQLGVVPDIVTMGKPTGNGYPLAACVARPELVEKFRSLTQYINTFASTPVQGAVGLAVLEEMERLDAVANAERMGALLQSGIERIVADDPRAGDVRRAGLFLGVDCVTDRDSKKPAPDTAQAIVDALATRGVLTARAGEHRNVVKIRPPLVFEDSHAGVLLDALADSFAAVATGRA